MRGQNICGSVVGGACSPGALASFLISVNVVISISVYLAIALRAGMMASRLNHRERVIPALTDHLEDEAG